MKKRKAVDKNKYKKNPAKNISLEQHSGFLEGRNPVIEALKSGREIDKILLAKGEMEGSIKKIYALAKKRNIVLQGVDRSKLDSMSLTKAHQGVIAMTAVKEYVRVKDILKAAEETGEQPFILILDGITDPHNLGSIMRTADGAGVHGIIIPKRRAVGLSPAVAKVSAGAVEYVPVARVVNISREIDNLKEAGIWIAGTDSNAAKTIYEADFTGPLAIVIGGEGEGMGRLVSEKCDFHVKIPMKGFISSLNASVSAALIMYEALKQRTSIDI